MTRNKRLVYVGMASVGLAAAVLCAGGCKKESAPAPEAVMEKAAELPVATPAVEQPATAPAEAKVDPAAQKPKDHPAH